jgi:molecular chaperone GrpE (heat shock protein)
MRFVPFWRSRAAGPSGCTGDGASDEIRPPPGTEKADQLDRLIAEVARLGREQFRATTLLEGCGSSLDQLGDTVREHIDQELREHAETSRVQGALVDQIRARLVIDLLPVADALQASIVAARDLIAAGRSVRGERSDRWTRMQRLLGGGRAGISEPPHLAALEGWLEGQVLVERRLLALLEREGVRPIVAVGEAFDPHYHVGVAVSDRYGAADGTVVAEEVRGYTLGDRVLRHAEVVVARSTKQRGSEILKHSPPVWPRSWASLLIRVRLLLLVTRRWWAELRATDAHGRSRR